MVLTENKHCFDIDVVVCLTLGIAPLILPAVIQRTGPTYYRYYQYWMEHLLPIYAVFYMMFVKGWRYNVKKIYKPFAFLVILGAFCMYFNHKIPYATYMYLQGDDLGPAITAMLPENQFLRLLVYLGLAFVLFAVEFVIFHFVYKKKKKEEIPANEAH